MSNSLLAEKIVTAYHHQNHRVADGLIPASTGFKIYSQSVINISQEVRPGELSATLDLFERLLDAHAVVCPICSQGAF